MRHSALLLLLLVLLAGCGSPPQSRQSAPPTPTEVEFSLTELASMGVTPEQGGLRCLEFVGQDEKKEAQPLQEIEWRWKVRNCGEVQWLAYVLVPIAYDGEEMMLLSFTVPKLEPGKRGEIVAKLRAPEKIGTSIGRFMIGARQDRLFKDELWAIVVVS